MKINFCSLFLIAILSSCSVKKPNGVYIRKEKYTDEKIVFSDSSFTFTRLTGLMNDTISGHYRLDRSKIILINGDTTDLKVVVETGLNQRTLKILNNHGIPIPYLDFYIDSISYQTNYQGNYFLNNTCDKKFSINYLRGNYDFTIKECELSYFVYLPNKYKFEEKMNGKIINSNKVKIEGIKYIKIK